MNTLKRYPIETVGGFYYMTAEQERLRIETKVYSNGNQAIRILLRDGRLAKLRKLDNDELKRKAGPAFKEIKRLACNPLSVSGLDSLSDAEGGTVYVAVSTLFDGKEMSVDEILELPAVDWVSLRSAAAILYSGDKSSQFKF